MKHYLFSITNNQIEDFEGEVSGTSTEYHQLEKSFGVEEIFYKTKDGKVNSVICEAYNERSARNAIKEFLDTLN